MRYRVTFFTGLAIGFVLGTRAGRERYEQMEKLARGIASNPAVRQAANSVASGITGLVNRGREKATSAAGGRLDRIPGLRGGRMPGGHDGPGNQRFTPAPGSTHGYPDGT